MDDLLRVLVKEVEEAYAAEGVAQGEAFIRCSEATNAALRTVWPFVVKVLREKDD